MVRLFFASTQFFPTHPFSGVTARQSVAYPYVLAFQGCRQVVGYFAAKSAVRFNRLLAFLRVEPFCFSGGVIFFYWKQVQWLYACVVMFSRRIRKSVLPLQLFILSCSHFFRYVEYDMLHSSASFFLKELQMFLPVCRQAADHLFGMCHACCLTGCFLHPFQTCY